MVQGKSTRGVVSESLEGDPTLSQVSSKTARDFHLTVEQQAMKVAGDIVTAYVSNNRLSSDELPAVLRSVYATLNELSGMSEKTVQPKPAVPIEESIKDSHITCLEDGTQLRTLKRYLRTRYGLTPDQYRSRWGLDKNYPMVAPSYTRKRSEVARMIGLGKSKRDDQTAK